MEDEATIRRHIHRYRRMVEAELDETGAAIASVMLAVAEPDMALIDERGYATGATPAPR